MHAVVFLGAAVDGRGQAVHLLIAGKDGEAAGGGTAGSRQAGGTRIGTIGKGPS